MSARRMNAGISRSATKRVDEPHPAWRTAPPARAAAPSASDGIPTTQSSAPSSPRLHASSSTSVPLYGRTRPNARTTGPSTSASSVGQRPLVGLVGEVVEGAVRDHCGRGRWSPTSVAQLVGAVLGVGDDRVHRAEQQAALGVARARSRRRQPVVDREHARALRRQQAAVEVGDAAATAGGRRRPPRRGARRRRMSGHALGAVAGRGGRAARCPRAVERGRTARGPRSPARRARHSAVRERGS